MTDWGELGRELRVLGSELWEKTAEDWVLRVQWDLTEPTCPTVIIGRVGSNSSRYRFQRDTLEEGIQAAMCAVRREVIQGYIFEPECPFTNPDDHR